MPRHMPRPIPRAERRRATSILIGLAALGGMLALVIAVPLVLLTAWQRLGPPIPSPHDLAGPDDGTVFVRVLCLVGWAAWASFTWSVLAEVLAQWRGWHVPAIGWQQRLAADLIAAVVVLFASPTVVSSVAAPVPPPAATAHPLPAAGASSAPAPTRAPSARATYVEHHVQAGEQMPALAERYLGDKYRWQAIAAATYGLPQPDGRTLRPGDTRVYPGWTVRIPTTSLPSSTLRAPDTALTSGTVLTSGAVPADPIRAPAALDAGPSPAGAAHPTVEYETREGDWVWHIADRFLGDSNRYPDIAALNPHLARKYGTAFPDHIEPGDTLRLPTDAHDRGPRQHATGTIHSIPTRTGSPASPPPASPPTTGARPSSPTTQPAPSASADVPSALPTSRTGSPPTPASPTAASSLPSPTGSDPTPTAPPHDSLAPKRSTADHGGVDLGTRGWVSADLALAVAAAAALVWIHRRRRYRPRPPGPVERSDPDLAPLPVAVAALDGERPAAIPEDDMDDREPHTRLAATVTHAVIGTDHAGQQVPLSDLPILGVGWTGPGAVDAARGLVCSLLSSGGPWTPTAEATLVTTRQTLTDLLPGTETEGLGSGRLLVADTLDRALGELERELLRRARSVADTDIDSAGSEASRSGDGRPGAVAQDLPPLVLLAAAPVTGGAATRLAAILAVGSRLAITAVLLGDWAAGDTWHIAPDGTTTGPGQDSSPRRRLNVLDQTTTAQILDTLREAHPDETNSCEPASAPLPAPPSVARAAPDRSAATGNASPPAAVHRSPGPAATLDRHDPGPGTRPALHLAVLGRPQLRTAGPEPTELRIRRNDGVQLLVYLAVEPGGATSDELMTLLWPQTRPQHSRGRFHTTLSELRHTLADAIDEPTDANPVQRTADRYHLDPALVEVDLWHLRAAVERAATAVQPDHHDAALHDVIRRYTGPVAQGHTWLWLDPHREAVRRHVLDAYAALAETEPDPRAALSLIQDAIRVDPYNEHLYQQAMHLHARLGSSDGIRTSLRTLTQRLGELDIPVSPATQHTASTLLERLALRERLRPTTRPHP